MIKKTLLYIWKIVSNKYVATLIVFAIIFLFLDENNLLVTLQQQKEVNQLHAIERDYIEAIKHDSIQAEQMKDNLPLIEKFGRETYYLKAKDEDIFVIEK